MHLGNLRPNKGAIKKRKKIGRGPGSGHGKTSTRGHKGQKARNTVQPWFEGGQMPLQRRVPKRGFKPLPDAGRDFQVVNVGDLARAGGASITPALLAEKGLVRSADRPVKILGDGEAAGAFEVRAHAYSKSAREKIEAKGGKVLWLNLAGAEIAPPKPKRIYRPKPVVVEEEPAAAKGKKDAGAKGEKGAKKDAGAKGEAGGGKPKEKKAAPNSGGGQPKGDKGPKS
jgi:large subunit ribosomal protein L15